MSVAVDIDDGYRSEWLRWRRSGIGASDVAAILGISPWESPYSVWAKKTGRVGDIEETEAMEMGLALEPAIAELFHRRTGMWVVGAQTWCEHPDEGWARATLDGWAAESPWSQIVDAVGGYEAKSTADSVKKWDELGVPPMYQAQVQFQMWVTGMERTWLGVLHGSFGLRFRHYLVERDEADIELIADRCRQFWVEHVEADVAPSVDGHPATTATLKDLAAEPGTAVELGRDVVAHVQVLADLKAAKKRLETEIDAESNAIRAALGSHTDGTVAGVPLVSWRAQQTTRPDLDRLRAHFPRALKKYSTTSTSRVLRLHIPKERS